MRGTVSSEGDGKYTAKVRFNVGPRTVVALKPITGASSARASRLAFALTAEQVRTIRSRAHAIHQAPVMYVTITGTVDGAATKSYGFAHVTVSVNGR